VREIEYKIGLYGSLSCFCKLFKYNKRQLFNFISYHFIVLCLCTCRKISIQSSMEERINIQLLLLVEELMNMALN